MVTERERCELELERSYCDCDLNAKVGFDKTLLGTRFLPLSYMRPCLYIFLVQGLTQGQLDYDSPNI